MLTSLILILKYGIPIHSCNKKKKVKTDLQTLLLAVVPLVLFGLAVDQGDIFSASTLFFLFFFSVWKGGNHRKITIIIEDPVAGLQCRGAASCPPLNFCYQCMIRCCHFLFCFSFFSSAFGIVCQAVAQQLQINFSQFPFSLFCFLAIVLLSVINIQTLHVV